MAEGLNRVILIGNLGQDPELKYVGNDSVLQLRMATTEGYYDEKSKERKEVTEWHSVVIWGKRAEALNKLLMKGSRIAVEGRLKTRSWEDKGGGGKRYATEINANNIVLLDSKGGGQPRSQGGPPATGSDGAYEDAEAPTDDEIPF